MAFIDETAVTVALPAVQGSLGATAASLASALGAALLIEGKKKPEEHGWRSGKLLL